MAARRTRLSRPVWWCVLQGEMAGNGFRKNLTWYSIRVILSYCDSVHAQKLRLYVEASRRFPRFQTGIQIRAGMQHMIFFWDCVRKCSIVRMCQVQQGNSPILLGLHTAAPLFSSDCSGWPWTMPKKPSTNVRCWIKWTPPVVGCGAESPIVDRTWLMLLPFDGSVEQNSANMMAAPWMGEQRHFQYSMGQIWLNPKSLQ